MAFASGFLYRGKSSGSKIGNGFGFAIKIGKSHPTGRFDPDPGSDFNMEMRFQMDQRPKSMASSSTWSAYEGSPKVALLAAIVRVASGGANLTPPRRDELSAVLCCIKYALSREISAFSS
jgi:hypothetical protein